NILLSAHIAEDLAQYRHWQPYLHDLGECEVKHGLSLHLFNLYKDNLGNPQIPERLKRGRWKQASNVVRSIGAPRSPKFLLLVAVAVSAVALIISSLIFFHRPPTRATIASTPKTRAARALAAIPEKSVAVLPFENRSEEKANAYFADGIQDEILMRLYKIADQLRAKLTGQEEKVISARPTDNIEAYDAYLRGLAYNLKTQSTPANVLGEHKYLREAVRLDPKFALAWALLSYVDAFGYLTL